MNDRHTSELLVPLGAAHREHYAFLRRRLSMLGVPDDALDDAAQDVFLVLVRRVRDYDPRFGIRQWMAGVARRVARRYRNAGGLERPTLEPDRLPSGVVSPEDAVVLHEARAVLDEFLGSLDREKWAVFVFAEIEGLPGREIAEELEINLNTVYGRLRAARSAFAAAVKRHRARERRRGAWLLAPLEWLEPWMNPSPNAIAAFVKISTAVALAFMTLFGVLVWWSLGSQESTKASDRVVDEVEDEWSMSRASRRAADIDQLRAPTSVLTGVVRDHTGTVLVGATVCAHTEAREVPTTVQRQLICATSGRGGYYALEGLSSIDYRVSASAPGHAPALLSDAEGPKSRREVVRLEPGETRIGADIVLEPDGVMVRGRLRDLAGGPIAGASVRVHEGTQLTGDSRFAACVTDDDGTFECWSSRGRVVVFAAAEGYTETWERGEAPGHAREMFLMPASTLVGRVVLAGTEEPVSGARVTARLNDRGGRPVGRAISEADGSFWVTGLEPGTYKLDATTPELYGLSREAAHLGLADTSAPIVIDAHPAFAISGKVVIAGTEGEPCSYGSVLVKADDLTPGDWTAIEPDGSVVIRALQPGAYRASVLCAGYVGADDLPSLAIIDASIEGVTWEVAPGLAIRGQVVHANGTPAVGVVVLARAKASSADPRAQVTSAVSRPTDQSGAFEISGLLAGSYTLTPIGDTASAGSSEVEVAVGHDLDGVRIDLVPTGAIRGTVRDERSEVVSGVWVDAIADAGGSTRIQTTADGSYHLTGVPAGSVSVRVKDRRAPGKTDDDPHGRRVTLAPGETTRVDLVVEMAEARITGHIADAEGTPIPDALVDAQRESDSEAVGSGSARRTNWLSPRRRPILTDVEGRFELTDLVDGTYTVTVQVGC